MLSVDFSISYLQLYFLIVSLLSFALYSYDKIIAIKSKTLQRVSENKLLFSTLIGGTLGSILAMLLFRHKIKKASFVIKFLLVFIFQILLAFFSIKGFDSYLNF